MQAGNLILQTVAGGSGSAGMVVTTNPATYNNGLFTVRQVTAPASLIDIAKGWAAFRYRVDHLDGNQHQLLYIANAPGNIVVFFQGGAVTIQASSLTGSSDVYSVPIPGWTVSTTHTLLAAWTETSLQLSNDGAAMSVFPRKRIPLSWVPTGVDIGGGATGLTLDGAVFFAAFGVHSVDQSTSRTIAALPNRVADDQWPFQSTMFWPAAGQAAYYTTDYAFTGAPPPTTGGSSYKYDFGG